MALGTDHAAWRRETGVIDMHVHLDTDYLENATQASRGRQILPPGC